eukprot:TRINITY_DN103418_c0_g1_i1.p1 TRINITY_DN103418_c0_g1~~TRINITY_DN103418_c0_g1_i1.p1  ORF type:complete len:332 (-),score=57.55 TRINITY_DN103418_c0_g1_i1:318-1313(-)
MKFETSTGITLTNDGMGAKRTPDNPDNYIPAFLDGPAFSRGLHSVRFATKFSDTTEWIRIGVIDASLESKSTYATSPFWGLKPTDGSLYMSSSASSWTDAKLIVTLSKAEVGPVEVDMIVDMDHHTLQYSINSAAPQDAGFTLPPKVKVAIMIYRDFSDVIHVAGIRSTFVMAKRKQPEALEVLTNNLWTRREFTDAVVSCGSQKFQVHRAVLAAACPVFQCAFAGKLQEGVSKEYKISDSHPAAVETLLRYCYTGEFILNNEEVLHQVYKLANMYEMKELEVIVVEAMLDGLTPENIVERGKELKQHQDPQWNRFLDIVAKDRTLLESMF